MCLSILRMGKTLHTNFQAKGVSGSFHPWCLASLSPPNTQITFFKITFIYFIGGRWACHGMHVKSDNSLWEWVLSFHQWGLWPGIQVTRLVSKYLYPLSRLTSPQHFFKVQTSRFFCHGFYFNEGKQGLWHLKFKNSPRARCGVSRL